ncbi:MAG: tRNA1(Val) (adenine(37)-N6)-methyltransferase [Patescibacteria group bacterium]
MGVKVSPPHIALKPGERIDALGGEGLVIIQKPGLLRFTTDAYLLAAFARPGRGETILELGSGTGAIVLLLAARSNAAKVTGLEIQPALVEMACRNIALNGLEARARVLEHDLRRERSLEPPGFGLIVANPPYIPVSAGCRSPSGPLAQAKHELTCTLRDTVRAAARWLSPKGRFVLVHRPERLPEIFAELGHVRFEPKELAMVHNGPGAPACRVLIAARPAARPGLFVHAPLLIRDAAGAFTPGMEEVFAGQWPSRR